MNQKIQSLPDFLAAGLDELNFDGDFILNWDQKQRCFKIEFTFFAENKEHDAIYDLTGVASDEPIITFLDSILIYDQTNQNLQINPDDYLVCLPFAGENGWTLAMGKAFFAYLQVVLDDGESDLLDFLNEEEIEVFELEWSKKKFDQLLADFQIENDQLLRYPQNNN